MTQLALILTDFFGASVGPRPFSERARSARGAGHEGELGTTMARLPCLETLLARAESEKLADWRAWLAARTGVTRLADLATVAAAAWHEPLASAAGVHYWFATPVHLFAGLDSVHLHPQGLLQLSDAEQQRLSQDFARVFADSRWRLTALGQRELLLRGPPLYASGEDPATLLATDPAAALPRGPDAPALRRLGAEIEMWLHEHAINLERTDRAELTVSALWLWGGQSAVTSAASSAVPLSSRVRPRARLYGRDTYAEALWRLAGEQSQPLPPSFSAEAALIEGPEDSVVLYPMMQERGLIDALTQLESRWLSGAMRSLRRRRLGELWCLAGTRAYRLTWTHYIRLWRARAPWWEGLT